MENSLAAILQLKASPSVSRHTTEPRHLRLPSGPRGCLGDYTEDEMSESASSGSHCYVQVKRGAPIGGKETDGIS